MEFVPGLPVLRRCVLQTLSALRGIEAGEVTQFHRDRAGRPADQGRKRLHLPVRFVELPEGQLQVQRESELQLRWRPVALGRKLRVESICRHWPGTGFGHVDYLARLGSTRMPDRGVCARPCTKMVQ